MYARIPWLPVCFVLTGCPVPGDTDDSNSTGETDTNTTTDGPVVVALAAGAATTCAVLDDGTAKCWGDGRSGQLGNGANESSVTPVAVSGLSDVTAIASGYDFSCAIHDGGAVSCWGSGANGRLGNGSTAASNVPVAVTGLTGATQITAGFTTACAVKTDGTVWCWGRGGDRGTDDLTDSAVPTQVTGLTDVAALSNASHYGSSSSSSHVCGAREDGTTFCWGPNGDGQNGDGTQNTSRTPVAVLGLDDTTAITTGLTHACASGPSGVTCWGASQQVGDGTVERRFEPTDVDTSLTFEVLSAGFNHTCGLTSGGDVWCWGLNGRGQIGDGLEFTSGDVRLSPAQSDVSGVTVLAAGMSHTCAYADRVTWCWGANEYGENGSGTPGSSARTNVPAPVVW